MRTLAVGTSLVLLIAIPCNAQSSLPPAGGLAGADAQAFDELVLGTRGHALRWLEAPALVLLMSVMRYEPGEGHTYSATSEQLTDAEAQALVDDLTAALGVLSGGTFAAFSGVRREFVDAGDAVDVLRHGQIVVGRFRGLQDSARTVGLGGRTVNTHRVITSGAMLLDADYDRASGRRRLLRTHELGHALGYNHVSARPSIMNAGIGADVTDFDRQAAWLATRAPWPSVRPHDAHRAAAR